MRFSTNLLPSRSGNVGIITINNVKSLNALTLGMIHSFQDIWQQWVKDDHLKVILIKPTHPDDITKTKAFCSGGDVKQVYLSGLKEIQDNKGRVGQGIHGYETSEFFRQEYYLNYMLCMTSKKYKNIPTISIWDGIVMGGGVGISIYNKYRVATEHTVFAMPETKIGLFPDIGSFYWMTRLNSKKFTKSIALYVALTGVRLHAIDLLYTGLATHYIPSNQLTKIEWELIEASTSPMNQGSSDIAASILMSYHQPIPSASEDKSIIKPNESIIHEIFHDVLDERHNHDDSGITMEMIFDRLHKKSTTNEFCLNTLQTLEKMSPTSLKLTVEGLYRGSHISNTIENDLQMEFRVGQHCIRKSKDFYEGIRATLIDKDNKPIYKPSTIHDISKNDIDAYFNEAIENEWILPIEIKKLFDNTTTTDNKSSTATISNL